MDLQRTLVLVKPDGVQRGLTGTIIGRFEATGMKIVGMKLIHVTEELASQHYAEHEGKPFYAGLVDYIISAPVVALCLEGPDAIAITRKLMGATRPNEAPPGTIRGDFGVEVSRNLVHGSADENDAAREVSLFFSDAELLDYARSNDVWIVSDEG